MNKEFESLYKEWRSNTMFLSTGNFDNEWWSRLVKWSKKHTKEAIEGVRELIADEPDHVVHLLDEIIENGPKAEGYVPLDAWCNLWIAIIDASKNNEGKDRLVFPDDIKDNYEDSRAYHEYLKTHYIPWNPFHEDDPNITLEEFRQGKRNEIHTVV
jgi:hypothetical protein